MHSFNGHPEGGGDTRVLRRLTTEPTYQTVTPFCRAVVEWRIVWRQGLICRAMKHQHKHTAVITGASSGIGLGLARGFLAAGFQVLANSRNVIDRAVERFGAVDVLINNAGIFVPKPFTEYTTEDFGSVVSTNLAGFFYISQAAVRHMRKNGGGQILSISTTLAQQPVAGVSAALTNLTKGGLNSVTRALAIEYAKEGIRVNAIAPGIVDTPMHQPESHENLKHLHPIARLASVEEIVDAALFLVRASFITGEVLYVDGGAQAGKW